MITRSQNGYRATALWLKTFKIGPNHSARLRRGNAGWMLNDMAEFLKTLEPCHQYYGYAARDIRGATTVISNHASGTAIDYNSEKHSLGAEGTWSHVHTEQIRKHLKLYEGCIRWGGDYTHRKDEMHFEINENLKTVNAVVKKIKKHRK